MSASVDKSRNPFRTPAVSPQPTGAGPSGNPPSPSAAAASPARLAPPPGSSSTSYTPPAGPPPSSSQYAPPPGPPPASYNPPSSRPPAPPERSDSPVEEPPPAYSLTPNPRVGESTVQYGPQRPFQRAPPPLQVLGPSPPIASPASQSYRPPRQAAGHAPAAIPPPTGLYRPPLHPPPRHPSTPSRPGPSARSPAPLSPGAAPSSPVSDFARDFYAVGVGAGIPEVAAASYAPPPGPPPPRRPSHSSSPSTVSLPGQRQGGGGGGGGSAGGSGSGVPDDGRPTQRPTPGHPLLKDGELLVYPAGYECHKCNNTGYKHYDPSHPCRRCWDRYAEPYAGAVVYAPWTPSSSGAPISTSAGRTFQRPLPAFRPPQRAVSPVPVPVPGGYPGALARGQSQYLQPPMARTRSVSSPGPGTRVVQTYGPAPPGAPVFPPGDPRIGGRLCWNCGGRGMTTFFIFDSETCNVCGGIGRLM